MRQTRFILPKFGRRHPYRIFYARSKGKKRAAALNFVPSKKNEDHDYLQQARENGPDLPEKRKK